MSPAGICRRRLRDLELERHLSDPSIKQRYVTSLFDLIAPGYDLFTRLFSFGMDRRWKRLMMRELVRMQPRAAVVLDLACGTGDLAIGAARRLPEAFVVGMDVSREMLRVAERNARNVESPTFVACDILDVAVADRSADVVLMGYGLRNTPDYRRGLGEVLRVLRPGGLLLNLDFYKPPNRLWRTLYLGYIRYAGAVAGWLWHREPRAYAYIAPSIEHYVSAGEFAEALRETGFRLETAYSRLGGGIVVHAAVKRRAGQP